MPRTVLQGHARAGPGQKLGHRGGQQNSLLCLQIFPGEVGKLKAFKGVLGKSMIFIDIELY